MGEVVFRMLFLGCWICVLCSLQCLGRALAAGGAIWWCK